MSDTAILALVCLVLFTILTAIFVTAWGYMAVLVNRKNTTYNLEAAQAFNKKLLSGMFEDDDEFDAAMDQVPDLFNFNKN